MLWADMSKVHGTHEDTKMKPIILCNDYILRIILKRDKLYSMLLTSPYESISNVFSARSLVHFFHRVHRISMS